MLNLQIFTEVKNILTCTELGGIFGHITSVFHTVFKQYKQRKCTVYNTSDLRAEN